MPFVDRKLVCRDCGKEFIWSAGEQEFFSVKGFSHPPSRCKEHRLKHKAQIEGMRVGGAPQRREYDIVCTNCGRPGKVPFEPTNKHALLCTDCFMNQRVTKASTLAVNTTKSPSTVEGEERANVSAKALPAERVGRGLPGSRSAKVTNSTKTLPKKAA